MSRSHGIKGETTDEVCQEQFFCWLLLVPALGFLTFKLFCMHKNLFNTLKERKKEKSQSLQSLLSLIKTYDQEKQQILTFEKAGIRFSNI